MCCPPIPFRMSPCGVSDPLVNSYIQDGLCVWLDARKEQIGTINSLHNWASDDTMVLSKAAVNNGRYVELNGYTEVALSDRTVFNANVTLEVVASVADISKITVTGFVFEHHVSSHPAVAPAWVKCWRIGAGLIQRPVPTKVTTYDDFVTKGVKAESDTVYSVSIFGTEVFYINGVYITPTEQTGAAKGGASGGYNVQFAVNEGCTCNLYSYRLYNRTLSKEEILHNYKIDKARFNLES